MKKIDKNITFIYSDSGEQAIYKPIAAEAKRRGYKIALTDDKFAKCEIGFYCQHVNFPQYSKFSFIMLHDIIQQYSNWPDLWLREPWNKYDVGFLPSNQWEENWNKCSQWYYANPRLGIYKIGWPKADNYEKVDKEQYKKEFNKIHGLDNSKMTVLYAPAWENDHKQDDFVQAMLKLDVNILIKQAGISPEYSQLYHDMYYAIIEMEDLHKDIPEVTILDPTTNIFEAIMASDVLVSEESSTMCEATMMGIPAVSVSNWLIPDVTPKRYPQCDYDFVFMTKKENLTECIENIISNYDSICKEVNKFKKRNFGEIGGSANRIMDIVDDVVSGKTIRYKALAPQKKERVPIKRELFHIYTVLHREISQNHGQRNPFIRPVYKALRNAKHIFK